MSLGKIVLIWVLAGALLGCVLFAGVYLMRDSLAAGAELSDTVTFANRSVGVLIVPALGVGWLAFAATSRLSSDAGLKRMAPLLLGGLVAIAVSLALQNEIISEYRSVTVAPAVLAVVAAVGTAWVFDWLDT